MKKAVFGIPEKPETLINIGEGAFEGCRNLIELCFYAKMLEVSSRAFLDCQQLEKFPSNKISWLGERVFYFCASLQSVKFANKDTGIGCEVFASCFKLRGVVFVEGEIPPPLESGVALIEEYQDFHERLGVVGVIGAKDFNQQLAVDSAGLALHDQRLEKKKMIKKR